MLAPFGVRKLICCSMYQQLAYVIVIVVFGWWLTVHCDETFLLAYAFTTKITSSLTPYIFLVYSRKYDVFYDIQPPSRYKLSKSNFFIGYLCHCNLKPLCTISIYRIYIKPCKSFVAYNFRLLTMLNPHHESFETIIWQMFTFILPYHLCSSI